MEKTVTYGKAPGYKLSPANGGWAMANPVGEITVDFYMERWCPPDKETIQINELTGTQVPSPVDLQLYRELQCGIVVSRETAYTLGKFLISKAREAGFEVPADDR